MSAQPGSRSGIKSLNILLLSSSGFGKSTLINSFANYASYKTPDEIRSKRDVKVPIPAVFMSGEDKCSVGEDDNQDGNESMRVTDSGTMGCKEHRYQFQDIAVNFIDTPGLGDTRGIDQDKENMAMILEFISRYKFIHGICILVKADLARYDDQFKYCIKELLHQLDRSAVANIIWIFTCAASTHYENGSGAIAVRKMIADLTKEDPELNIPFDQNHFLFENDVFRFIIAKQSKRFPERAVNTFTHNWNFSRLEFRKMIEYIRTRPTYNVVSSICLNQSRQLIQALLPLLRDITENIIQNEEACRIKTEEIKGFVGTIESLRSVLFIPKKRLETEYYDEPKMFCSACKELPTDGSNSNIVIYNNCSTQGLTFWQSYLLPHVARRHDFKISDKELSARKRSAVGIILISLTTIVGIVGTGYWSFICDCSTCGCKLGKHFQCFYETREIEERVLDEKTQETLTKTCSVKVVAETFLIKLLAEKEKMQSEQTTIDRANATFAVFLQKRSLVPYNDSFPGYLNFLIEGEKTNGNRYGEKLKALEAQLLDYEEMKRTIDKAVSKGGKRLEPKYIQAMVGKLQQLPTYGKEISIAIENGQHMNQALGKKSVTTTIIDEPIARALGDKQLSIIDAFKQYLFNITRYK